ncbi:LacI family transcriptional regulator [Paenibacillus sp. CC-CFT747]|nr:LacI family transcriptional regulator [Paenibacillus sp. CC-CFT747]
MPSSIDVAKKAGVSQATVSRVLNNPESVKSKTREKVFQAVQELQYFPNEIARSLVTNTTRTIALISGPLRNGFFVETTDAIVRLAKSKGYKTIVYLEDENRIPNLYDLIMSNKVDGVLLSLMKLDDPLMEKIDHLRIPCVFFIRKPRLGGNYVILDNKQALSLAVRHLLDLGHRDIAYISGNTDFSTFYDRYQSFQDVMNEKKITINPNWVKILESSTEEIEKATFSLLHKAERPTAIICSSDSIALICIDVILSVGLRIPEDISLTGVDDIHMSSHQAIQLTTVRHQKFAMGQIAAETLFELIDQPKPAKPIQISLKPELIVRKTTAAVKRV